MPLVLFLEGWINYTFCDFVRYGKRVYNTEEKEEEKKKER